MAHLFPAATGEPDPSQVRAELDRILASELFLRSDRLSAFLRFIVDETLKGGGATLKEHVIAVELYGKDADFDTATDPIVRVDARRLRDKLREYYASAPPGPVVISVPKGSYTPVFDAGEPVVARQAEPVPLHAGATTSRDTPETSARNGWRRVALAGLAVALVGASAWLVVSIMGNRASGSAQRLLTVTSFPGPEDNPTLSPDGNFIAFNWPGPDGGIADDIWVAPVEGEGLRRLTQTPVPEKWPAWSPDGRSLAFTRIDAAKPTVVVMSALGGPERVIEAGGMPAWMPDSRALVMVSGGLMIPGGHGQQLSLVHHVLDTGARRELTSVPDGFMDGHPRVSPDGRMVAFHRYGAGRSALFVVPLEGGEPRLVGDWVSGLIGGLTWTPDGREIIYARPETSGRRLVRTTLTAPAPVAVSGVSFNSTAPTVPVVRNGAPYRLGFVSGQVDLAQRLIDLSAAADGRPLRGAAFADATRMDLLGRFSPDGTEIAFVSDRGGSQQVWVATREGSTLRTLTHLDSATINVWSWSPDGQWVAFDATTAGSTDIYAVRRDGGGLKRLTEGPAIEIDPEWSRDGGSIYYSSNASGTPAIWRMPAAGGRARQITTGPGFEPRVSPDGRRVYFVDQPRRVVRRIAATLKEVSSEGGTTAVVQQNLTAGAWDVTDSGVVFLATRAGLPDQSPEPDVIMRYDFADRQVHQVGTLEFLVAQTFASRYLVVSRDGRWAVASHLDRFDRDIMVLENFK